MAVGGIALLAFMAMAIVAAVYPERGPKAVADQDPGTGVNPFPTLPANPTITAGPGPGATGSPRPGSSRPPVSGAPTGRPTGAVTGAYALPPATTWANRFQGQVSLTNTTASSQSWQVRIVFPDNVDPYVVSWINGSPGPSVVTESHGATFSGSLPIPAGKTVVLFFEFERTAGDLTPRSCTVNGRACSGV